MQIDTIRWVSGKDPDHLPGLVRLIDQTRLPLELHYIETRALEDILHALRVLQVRGAPAIGIAAAMGVALAAQHALEKGNDLSAAVAEAAEALAATRPTAVNLSWALQRMRRVAGAGAGLPDRDRVVQLIREARRIRDEDEAICRRIGEHGAALLRDGQSVLTHCNAGGLATAGYGTALAPVYRAQEEGRRIHVFADETRPLLQGARLTAWELGRAGIACTLICDHTAACVMREGRVDAVLVGADRIARNGDTANKVGTYGVALHARHHGIPFYVCAPVSTFDPHTADGAAIPIEERRAEEVTEGFGPRTAPPGVAVYAPAFDITPAELVTAYVTEKGILQPPFEFEDYA